MAANAQNKKSQEKHIGNLQEDHCSIIPPKPEYICEFADVPCVSQLTHLRRSQR